jgi:hypothetical protein
MIRPSILLALSTILLLQAAPAIAWNAAGHRLSAYIAWQKMDEVTRKKVEGLLLQHPDHEHWLKRAKNAPPALAAFLEASTWPDDIKSDRRFHDSENETTAPIRGFSDRARHRQWHYINRPLAPLPSHSPKEVTGQLDGRLAELIEVMRSNDDLQRIYALPWLIHLVADAHQPLHVVSRYDREGQSDDGGNALTIATPFHPRLATMNLHAYWDDLPGPPWLRGERLEQAGNAIMEAHPRPPPVGTISHWIEESWQIAAHNAYPDDTNRTNPPPEITPEFNERAQEVARQRIAEAGYRLAFLLQRLLKK